MCEDCPLGKIPGGEHIQCVSDVHAHFCNLARTNKQYDKLIIEQSVKRHEIDKGAEMPGLGESVLSFGEQLWKWGKRGFETVPDEVYEARLAICESCDNFEPVERRCSICTCYLDKNKKPFYVPVAKTQLIDAHCPLDPPFWNVYKKERAQLPEGSAPRKSGCGCGR